MRQNSKYISKTRLSTNDLNTNKSKTKKPIIKTKNIIRTNSSDINFRKKYKSRQKIKTEEEKNFKQTQDIKKGKTNDSNYSSNYLRENKIKIKANLNRLVDNSKILLEKQNEILSNTNSLMHNIEINNHEIDKIFKKNSKQNFCKCLEEFNPNLENILSNLKQNTKIVEFSNKIKQENDNLQYKMQILSIDKNDDFRILETKLNSFLNIFTNEMNSMIKFLYELGHENISFENITTENLSTDIIVNYFNMLKKLIKEQKLKIEEKERQIKLLNKLKFSENKQSIDIKEEEKNCYMNDNNDRNHNNNYSSIEYMKNSINNDRLKKIEDLCIHNTYDIDNIKENNNISRINFDNFQRSKNIINNNELNNNSDLGIQLEHNYTDSYFYPNIKESVPNKKISDEINNNNMKEYISRINESQPMNKFD